MQRGWMGVAKDHKFSGHNITSQVYIGSMLWCTKESCVKTKLCQLFLLELVKQVHGLLTVTYCNRSSLEIITSFHSFQQVYYITSVDFGCGVMNIVVISTQQIQNTSKIINQILQSKKIFFCVLAVQGLCFINKILGRPDQANDSLVWTCDRHQLQPIK